MSDSVRPHRRQPTRLRRPWDSPGKNTGVGCHFLLQCMKVKSESEAAQSCPTLRDPMDCSPPGSSVHGIFQARGLEWGAIAFSEHVMNQTKNAHIGIMLRKMMQTHLDKIKQSSIKHIKISCLGIGCHTWYTFNGFCICDALRWSLKEIELVFFQVAIVQKYCLKMDIKFRGSK